MRDGLINSITVPSEFTEELLLPLRVVQNDDTTSNVLCDRVFYRISQCSDTAKPITTHCWFDIEGYKYKTISTGHLSRDEHSHLKAMYTRLYPAMSSDSVVPYSFKKCKSVSIGNEVFGSSNSRHCRSAWIMANWNAGDGKIVEDDNAHITPGVIDRLLVHNILLPNRTYHTHILAKVRWFAPREREHNQPKFKAPVEIWGDDVFDTVGESAFIPIQRIACKFVRYKPSNKSSAVYTCPISKRLSF